MANTGPTTLSLFSGVGGLDLGWELATGARTVGYCERDAYAAGVLLARMEDQSLEPAPIWCGDVQELPLEPFRGVDAIIGGFPCQDISVAGKGAGILEGNRSSLWRTGFVRAIRELRPRYVFVENVGALAIRGLDIVLGDLAEIGYDTQWSSLRASAVGAPHRRDRVFILGHAAGARRGRGAWRRVQHSESGARCGELAHAKRAERGAQTDRRDEKGQHALLGNGQESAGGLKQRCSPMAHAGGERRQQDARSAPGNEGAHEERAAQHGNEPSGAGADVGNAERDRLGIGGRAATEITHEGFATFPPGPGAHDEWAAILAERPWLAPAVKPGLRVLVDGLAGMVDASRADQLRCVGNGVVALQAAVAARLLLRRAAQ